MFRSSLRLRSNRGKWFQKPQITWTGSSTTHEVSVLGSRAEITIILLKVNVQYKNPRPNTSS